MATSVNQAFDSFHSDTVNLLSDRTDKARSSRDYLVKQLNLLPDKEPTYPIAYTEKHNNYGSFARKTKIRELDDVDMIYCMSSTGATYIKDGSYQNTFDIHTTTAGKRLSDMAVGNILNSNKVLGEIQACLKDVENYSEAKIHKKNEAITLKLLTYEWNFDILPAFYTDTDFYLIPDGEGRWKATNPNIDQERTTSINQKHSGQILQIIRTIKYWSRYQFDDTMSSYLLENFIVNFFNSRASIYKYIDYNLRDFWLSLSSSVYNSVYDPKGFDGDINQLIYAEKAMISQFASTAYKLSDEAINAETVNNDHKTAIGKWRQIFGSAFPAHG